MDLTPCEFRKERPIEGDEAGRREIVCQAANFARLAVAGEDACLHLRPVKMLDGNSQVTHFALPPCGTRSRREPRAKRVRRP